VSRDTGSREALPELPTKIIDNALGRRHELLHRASGEPLELLDLAIALLAVA
jgi:hypothetical protein